MDWGSLLPIVLTAATTALGGLFAWLKHRSDKQAEATAAAQAAQAAAWEKRYESMQRVIDMQQGTMDKQQKTIDYLGNRVNVIEAEREEDLAKFAELQVDLGLWKSYSRAMAEHGEQLVGLLRGLGYAGEIPPSPEPPARKRTAKRTGGRSND